VVAVLGSQSQPQSSLSVLSVMKVVMTGETGSAHSRRKCMNLAMEGSPGGHHPVSGFGLHNAGSNQAPARSCRLVMAKADRDWLRQSASTIFCSR